MKNKLITLTAILVLLTGISCRHIDTVDVDLRNTSDYLFLIYCSDELLEMDGNYGIIYEAENALYNLRNKDGTPKEGCPSVNVLALYDPNEIHLKNSVFVSDTSQTVLLEVGPFDRSYNEVFVEGELGSSQYGDYYYSPQTIDLSSKAPWLFKNGRQEVNMSSAETLDNFLNFANTYYKAKKTILILSGHGMLPDMELDYEVQNSRNIIPDNDKNGDTSYMLRNCDIVYALNKNGFTGDNRLEMLISTCCLDNSIEKAYDIKDNVKYYVATPDEGWSIQLNYNKIIADGTKENDLVKACSDAIDVYLVKLMHLPGTYTISDLSKDDKMNEIKTLTSQLGTLLAADKDNNSELLTKIKTESYYAYDGAYDLGLIAHELAKAEGNGQLSSTAKKLCDALSEVIVYAARNDNYHDGYLYKTIEGVVYPQEGNCYGFSITTAPKEYYSNTRQLLENVKWNQCTTFAKDNEWQRVIDLP